MIYKYNTKEILKEINNCEDYYWNNKKSKWEYKGILNIGNKKYKIMHWLAKKAYCSWICQGIRCNNKNNCHTKYYYDKGIKRIWDNRTCINFWINEFFKRDGWNKPVMTRKNDVGNYCENNCELKEHIENNKEIKITEKRRKIFSIYGIINGAINGAKTTSKNIKLININNKDDIIYFSSINDGGLKLNKSKNYLRYFIKNNKLVYINNKYYKIKIIFN